MKKLLSIIMVIALVFTFAACSSQNTPDTDEEGSNKNETTTFTVGFDAAFPPYGYQDENGNYVGFDLDLAAEVCKRQGWELVLQPIDWKAKDMELESGAIDCIWNGFTMSEDRIDDYTWSKPYVDNSQVFVVAKDSGIASKADLAGKIVIVQSGSSALEALNSEDNTELKASFKELVEVPDYNTAFLNLESGSVEAIAMDIGVAKYQLENRDGKYIILEDTLITEQYGIGFLLGNTQLKDAVETSLNEMLDDGTLMEIAQKWGLQDSIIYTK